jgi:hypothetical protein
VLTSASGPKASFAAGTFEQLVGPVANFVAGIQQIVKEPKHVVETAVIAVANEAHQYHLEQLS